MESPCLSCERNALNPYTSFQGKTPQVSKHALFFFPFTRSLFFFPVTHSLFFPLMPSIAPAGALLSLFDPENWDDPGEDANDSDDSDGEEDDADTLRKNPCPFFWPAFQAQTGIMRPIFSPTPLAETPQAWKSEEDNAAVWSFVRKFWSLPKTQKVTFISRKTKDNNALGRVLFLDWLKVEYPRWGVNQIILSSLSECGVDPYSAIKLSDGRTKVCPIPSSLFLHAEKGGLGSCRIMSSPRLTLPTPPWPTPSSVQKPSIPQDSESSNSPSCSACRSSPSPTGTPKTQNSSGNGRSSTP